MKSKNAQSQMAFIYIGGLIVFVAILILGISYIAKTKQANSDSSYISLQSALSRDISSITSASVGTSKSFSYKLPPNVEEICFIDPKKASQNLGALSMISNEFVRTSIEAESQDCVYLISKDFVKTQDITGFSMAVPYFCIKVGDNLEVDFEKSKNGLVVKGPVDESYCTSAEEQGVTICQGLDTFFYDGYSKRCCDDYDLCCYAVN